jgi:hypothetical protein
MTPPAHMYHLPPQEATVHFLFVKSELLQSGRLDRCDMSARQSSVTRVPTLVLSSTGCEACIELLNHQCLSLFACKMAVIAKHLGRAAQRIK